MATVYEIAAAIEKRLESVDRARLLKLVYYVQAWSLVFHGHPAFSDRIEAWRRGPVAKSLWVDMEHNGRRLIKAARAAELSDEESQAVDHVLFHYGQMSAKELSALTHFEEPWLLARGGTPDDVPSSNEIGLESIRSYYARVWLEAIADNNSLTEPPAFVGTVDELERFLDA